MTRLSREEGLGRIAHADRLLIAVDFDGTLSHLHDEPMKARMIPAARAAIERLSALPDTTIAFVSGRSLHDLREIAEHGDDSPILLAGSHGAEFWVPGEGALEPDADEVDDELRDVLYRHAVAATDGMEGVWIEPKTFGLGVHTRTATPETAAAADAAVDAIVAAEAPHWRRRTGKNIVEYAFRHEGKDSAIAALRERVGATAVIFAGDDVTDEDALVSLGEADLGVHVGASESAASVFVDDVEDLAAFLDELATERAYERE
ncbi:trehalose-phosphatase [Microbacterium sp.]|uniref:trehalose-phosphatase n=1 Tax=Microbacterium sp. TaxID=51671 RepID=UPI003F71E54A